MTVSHGYTQRFRLAASRFGRKQFVASWCRASWTRILLTAFLFLCAVPGFSQKKKTDTSKNAADTVHQKSFIETLQEWAQGDYTKSVSDYNEARTAVLQGRLLEQVKNISHEAKSYLKSGIDTVGIAAELENIKAWRITAIDGVLVNTGSSQTHRNLATSYKILVELRNRATTRKHQVDRYEQDLVGFKNAMDSILIDTVLYQFSKDSATALQYVIKLQTLGLEVLPTDSLLKQAIKTVQEEQITINLLVNLLEGNLDEIAAFEGDISRQTFNKEVGYFSEPPTNNRPMKEIIRYSAAKARLLLAFFAQHNIGKTLLVILLIFLSTYFLTGLKKKVRSEGKLRSDFSGQLVLRYPLLSAMLIVPNLFQFMYPDPPFVFIGLFWVLASVCLPIIFHRFITRYWMVLWITMWVLFILACADNLILQGTRAERWFMLGLAIAGVLFCTLFLAGGHKRELRERAILYFIAFLVILELGSVVANLYGRYNLAKSLLTSGFINVIIAILFLWTVRLINEGLSLAGEMYSRPEKRLFYINFNRIGTKAPPIFYFFLVIGWFILFARNFYAYKLIADPFEEFLFAERTIGNYTFNIKGVLIFILILVLAMLISRIVSFFASDQQPAHVTGGREKAGLGSWLLLVRIGIISMGIFLAFAAAGIPVDRITIILGALSVGVGLGLQSLVNNLVSGLIIAFEKPVNEGDIVDVGGKAGTVKSIGFRSSVLHTWEGANVVIPNGDLLSEHVVNWTQGNTLRRGDIEVGVAYGTDLDKAKRVLEEIIQGHDKILKNPSPSVLIKEFGPSSIQIQVYFWMAHAKDWLHVKSDIISAISRLFKENEIEIPFPQQELHIRSINSDSGQQNKT